MYLWKKTAISCYSHFLSLSPSYVNAVHKIKTFSACNFNHVRSPTDFSQRLPIESAKYLRLRVILRWLISLAVSALAGRYIGQDVLRPRPPAYALAASWLWAGTRSSWPRAPACRCSVWKEIPVPGASKKCGVLCESLQPGWLRGWLEGHLLCYMAKSPASCLVLPTCWNSLVTWSGTRSALAQTRLSQLL